MLELGLYIVSGLYLLEYLFFHVGIRRALRVPVVQNGVDKPTVSIVVAARNEEKNIESCLRALAAQDHPRERLQIVAVNDESEDATLAIMHRVAADVHGRIDVISTVPESSRIGGKARAIAQGMDRANGELILLTDADCAPPPEWVSSIVARFLPGIDVVAGYTVVRTHNLFTRLQQLDWLHLQSIAAAWMNFGSPVGVVGNNMAFRRERYERIGGYRKIHFSVTEDFALFKALHNNGGGIAYICAAEASVITEPCESLSEVLRQKHRWGRGGRESSFSGYSILIVAFLMLVAFCVAPFVSPTAWIVVWGVKFVADLLLLVPVLKELRLLSSLRSFLPFQFYFIVQAVVVPLLIVNRNVTWKGRVFKTVGPNVRPGGG